MSLPGPGRLITLLHPKIGSLTYISGVPAEVPGAGPVGEAVMMFGGEDNILSSRPGEYLHPLGGVEEVCPVLSSELLVGEVRGEMGRHELIGLSVSYE